MLTTQYALLIVLLDFIPTNLGDTLQFKVDTVFSIHTSIANISFGITFSLVLHDRIYLRNILDCPRCGLLFVWRVEY
jgi:hypothetical protein